VLLTAPKLDYLLRRYMRNLQELPLLADGSPCNRLNFDELERLDVLRGLLDYAGSDAACMERLAALYAASPLKPWGDVLTLENLRRLAEEASAALHSRQKEGA